MGIHGGDVYRNHVELDFSTNVNPLGMPAAVRAAMHAAVEQCGRYPDIEAERLRDAVSNMLGVPGENLLFGNGASELFMAVFHAIRPKRTVIVVPSFYGYEHAAKAVDSEIVYYRTRQEDLFHITDEIYEILAEDADLLIFANPGNPAGTLLHMEEIRGILEHCRERGIYVVLDECFIEFAGVRFSMLSEIKAGRPDNLVLVRAFTKIFSIPGVRLGYLVCGNQSLVAKIRGQLPEWNLSCIAQEAGCSCASQADFIVKTQGYVSMERQFLAEGLRRKGCQVFPSAANFMLVYCGEPLYERLLGKGILIRDCSNFRGLGSGFYRIAVKTRRENELLLEALQS